MSPGPSSRGEPPEATQFKSTGGLSSNEVNFLVYRYLLESGFGHSAFAFGCESDVDRIEIEGKDVPVGALVSFIQKGFQMMEIEANLNASGSDVYGKYVQFSANDILTKDLDELRMIAKEMQSGESLEAGVPHVNGDTTDGHAHAHGGDIIKDEQTYEQSVLPPLHVKIGEGDDGMDVDQPEVHVAMKEEGDMVEVDKEKVYMGNGDVHQNDNEGMPSKLEEPLPPSPPPRIVDHDT